MIQGALALLLVGAGNALEAPGNPVLWEAKSEIEAAPARWEQAKAEGEACYNRILAGDRDPSLDEQANVRDLVIEARGMLHSIEAKERADLRRLKEFLKDHLILGLTYKQISAKLDQRFAIHMYRTYGWMMPGVVNESLGNMTPEQKARVACYPMKIYLTDKEYEDKYAPISRDITCLVARHHPEILNSKAKKNCPPAGKN